MPTISAYKDEEFFTYSCKIHWYSAGVFTGSDYSDVNTVIRSNNGKLLATGDDFGKVRFIKHIQIFIYKTHNI
jgi:microtubule-associated protein-like 1/2